VTTEREFFTACEDFLNHDQPMPLEPFSLSLKETDVMAGEQR
jgi:tRNA-dihydrouridine synthase B